MEWGTADFRQHIDWEAYEANTCRELVEVPGGVDWKIRKLNESHPQFCWRYIDATVVAQYYFDLVRSSTILRETGSQQKLTSIPTFYATLPHFVSPFEISIQPKFLDKVREKLAESLGKFYNHNQIVFEKDQIFEKVPCVVPEGGHWYRGRIIKATANSSEVRLVDYGLERIVNTAVLRPLASQFSRIPPLALKCRVRDVYINDLDTAKVEKFKEIVKACNNLIRVEVCSNEEPFFVNIFHPTILTENLGKPFFRPEDHAERELAKQKKWLAHVRRENNDDDSDFSDEEEEYEEDDGDYEPLYVKSFERSPKFPRGHREPMTVSHVENSTLIYLKADWMLSECEKIEQALRDEWDSLPLFPTVSVGSACVVRMSDGSFHRAVVDSVDDGYATVLLLDYGNHVETSMSLIRPVPFQEPFLQPALVFVVSLAKEYNYFPHPSETDLLRQLIPTGSLVTFDGMKTRSRVPVLGKLFFSDSNTNVDDLLAERMSASRVDVDCRSVLPFYHREYPLPPVNPSFIHRLSCPAALSKGNLSECNLAEF